MSSGMKTRKNDGRPTSNSGKRNLISANVGTKTKKRRVQDKPIPTDTTNETSNKNNSGTSSSDNSDEEYENATDTENDNEMDPPKKPSGKKKSNNDNNESNVNEINKTETKTASRYRSMFNLNLKSKILLYVRNELFKKIKILGNEHLSPDGAIMKEALKKVQFNPQTDNIHAYTQECKKLLKQTMCSRRGYVKKKIGKKLRGKSVYFK